MGVAAAALTTAVAPGAASAQTCSSPCSFTTPGTHGFVVPDGVTSLDVVLVGGRGADGALNPPNGVGGSGARVTGTLAVTPGQQLYAVVGGNGDTDTGQGGANGGGRGASLTGGGGGASDVRTCLPGTGCGALGTAQDPRLAVAGGGGGGTPSNAFILLFGANGGAAGEAGAAGQSTDGLPLGGGGGQPGGADAGGAGGDGAYETDDGQPGTAGAGGSGAPANEEGSQIPGAGGGGGWYGGGGGGAGYFGGLSGQVLTVNSGGGGGGSSHTGSMTGAAVTTDTSGSPSITFTFSADEEPVEGPALTLDTVAAYVGTGPGPSFSGTSDAFSNADGRVQVLLFQGGTVDDTPDRTLEASFPEPLSGAFQATTSDLPEGTWAVVARQTNAQGGTTTTAAQTFTVDRTAPAVAIAAPANGAVTTSKAVTGFADRDAGAVTLRWYAGTTATGTPVTGTAASVAPADARFSGEPATLADGTYTVEAVQTDPAGNVGRATATFRLDTTRPPVSVTSPANGATLSVSQPLTVTGLAGTATGDTPSVTIQLFSGSTASGTPYGTLTAAVLASGSFSATTTGPLLPGTWTVRALQRDAAGNQGTSLPHTFTVGDVTPPSISLSAPPAATSDRTPQVAGTAGMAAGDSATVTIELQDAGGTVRDSFSATRNVSTGAFAASGTVALPDGTYKAVAKQLDDAANTGTATRDFIVDGTAPSLSVTAPAEGQTVPDQGLELRGVAGTAARDADLVALAVYAGTAATGTPVWTGTADPGPGGAWSAVVGVALAEGPHVLRATQGDSVGNVATVERRFAAGWPVRLAGDLQLPPAFNSARAGTDVSVSFSLGGNRGSSPLRPGFPQVVAIDCTTGAPTGTPSAASGKGSYSVALARFTYTWSTERAWAGSCRALLLGLDDGTTRTVRFRFTS